MLKPWIQASIKRWTSDGIVLNPGASASAIAQAEQQLGFSFPQDFKDFYLEMNGFFNFDWTETMFSIWPLERIIKEYDECRTKTSLASAIT